MPKKLIFVVVRGGVAEVIESTVPDGVEVEIIDYDNLAADPEEFNNLSAAAREQVRAWERE